MLTMMFGHEVHIVGGQKFAIVYDDTPHAEVMRLRAKGVDVGIIPAAERGRMYIATPHGRATTSAAGPAWPRLVVP